MHFLDEEEDYPVEIEPDLHRAFARSTTLTDSMIQQFDSLPDALKRTSGNGAFRLKGRRFLLDIYQFCASSTR
jgi:hypothetical protein